MELNSQMGMFLASILGLVIPIFIMFWTFKGYDKHLDDQLIFLSLVLGFAVGMVTALIYRWTIAYYFPNLTNIVIFVVLMMMLPFFDNLLKLIILNMKKFGDRFDTTFYGASLGAGISSMVIMSKAFEYFTNGPIAQWKEEVGTDGSTDSEIKELLAQDHYSLAGLLFFTIAIVLINVSIGIYIGYGCHKRKSMRYVLKATLISVPFWIILLLWYAAGEWVIMCVGALYAGFVYYQLFYREKIQETVLPGYVPTVIQRKDLRKKGRMKKGKKRRKRRSN